MIEGRSFQYMTANGNEVYKARKKHAKEGKKGDIEKSEDGNNKGDNNAVIERTREMHATQTSIQITAGPKDINIEKKQANRKKQASDAIVTVETIKNTSYENLNASLWETYQKSLKGVQTLIKEQQIKLEAYAQRETRGL